MAETQAHVTVLREEAVASLMTDSDGFYVDGTFGRGGHSRALLQQLGSEGQVLAIDKDPEAIVYGRQMMEGDCRLSVEQGSFALLDRFVQARGKKGQVSGVLLDLGVSSPQLDEAERGFSFGRDGPLDMRMDTTRGETAAQWLARAEMDEIARVLREYGEERYARRIARALVAAREEAPIVTTARLAAVVKAAHPRWEKHHHPATRAFQGIRIHLNRELEDLDQALIQALEVLAPGGRLVVISFHSLEDRRVKRFIRDQSRGRPLPRDLPVTQAELAPRLRPLGKAQRAQPEEVARNVRARSAIMRVAEKLA